jgi:pseudouridine synthase
MAARGRNSPGPGARRRDVRPGGQRGFKTRTPSQERSRGPRAEGAPASGPRRTDASERGRFERPRDFEPRKRTARNEVVGKRAEAAPPSRPEQRRYERKPDEQSARSRSGDPARRRNTGRKAAVRAERENARPRSGSPTHREPAAQPAPPKHSSSPRGEPERLQKVLARMGVASRREAEEWIRAGRLTVNGEPAVLGTRVGRTDHLRLDGRLIHRHEVAAGQVYLCHRSPGENLRTPEEPSEHQALMDRLPRRAGNRFIAVSPMPRIDGGLEIVTSDGSLAVQLQRTVHSLPSEFSVRVRGELEEQTLRSIMEGTLDRGVRLQVESCEPGGGEAANRWYTIVARGGSGKDVRQLFERHGALVSRVLRTKLGTLELDRQLSRGQFRPLTEEEIRALLESPAVADSAPE